MCCAQEQMNYMSYNEKSDVWSLGCLLHELCALRPPFTAANQKELATKICVGSFSRLPLRYSADLNKVIAVMLQVDVSAHMASNWGFRISHDFQCIKYILLNDIHFSAGKTSGMVGKLY